MVYLISTFFSTCACSLLLNESIYVLLCQGLESAFCNSLVQTLVQSLSVRCRVKGNDWVDNRKNWGRVKTGAKLKEGALGFSVLRIWPICGSVFWFSLLKIAVFQFWRFVRFAGFLQFRLRFSVFVNNNDGFSDSSAQ